MTTRWWLLESSILLFSLFFCGWYSKRAFYDPCFRLCCHPANWRSRSVNVCFTCARNIVFQHKINCCVDVERMVCFPYVWLCFIGVSFEVTHMNIGSVCGQVEFTVLSSTWWTQNGFISVHREHGNPEHTLAPICWADVYASAFRRRRHYVFGLSVRPSVRLSVRPSVRPSEAWNTLVWPVHGSVGPADQPWPFYSMSVRPSVRLSVRPSGEVSRNLPENAWREWPEIFLALFSLRETGQIWGFRAFPGERMEEMASNFAPWCILTTFKSG